MLRQRLVASLGVGAPAIPLLGDGELDTLALGQRDPGLLAADDEDVALTGGELVVNGVLDVHDVEASVVALAVGDDTDTTHVATTSSHGDHTGVEADEVRDLACFDMSAPAAADFVLKCPLTSRQVDLDGVVDTDSRVGVTDPTRKSSQYTAASTKTWSNV